MKMNKTSLLFGLCAILSGVAGSCAAQGLSVGFSTLPSSGKGPVILALHGIQTNAEWFRPLSVEMARHKTGMTAVNIPVRGKPQPGPADATDWNLNWVQPLIAKARAVHHDTGRPVVLLGTSWGARVVLRAALDAGAGADWCRGVVLVAPALSTHRDLDFAWRAKLSPATWFASRSSVFEVPLHEQDYTRSDAIAGTWLRESPGQPEAQGNCLVRQATLRHFDQTAALRKEVAHTLGGIQVPVLAVFGGSDELVNLHAADTLLNQLGGPRETRILPDCPHAMQVQNTSALAVTIDDWLDRTLLHKPAPQGTVQLDSRIKFQNTPVQVVAGRTYRFELPAGQLWQDSSLHPCAPENGDPTLYRVGAGILLRVRHDAANPNIRVRYFQPVVCFGENEATALIVQPGREWTAPQSGTLSAFVNDAPWPRALHNNHGTITFRIVPVSTSVH